MTNEAYGVVISLSVSNPHITEWLRPESVPSDSRHMPLEPTCISSVDCTKTGR